MSPTLDASAKDGPRRSQLAPAAFCPAAHGEYREGVGTLRGDGGDCGQGSETLLAYGGGNGSGEVDAAACLSAHGRRLDFESETLVTAFSCKDHGADAGEMSPTLRGMGHDASHPNAGGQVAIAFQSNFSNQGAQGDKPTLTANAPTAIALHQTQDPVTGVERSPALSRTSSGMGVGVGMVVRRLTPRECERLQGFPDDYTFVEHGGRPAKDGPRYKALGNSMAVTVMAWIGRRIDAVDRS